MTDKEIIIDGVDVAGCEYLDGFCEKYDTSCDEGGNCIYKQLKRLEPENIELKAENEKLKEATDGLLNIQYTLADSCKKYSETLQEIKELAEVGQDKYHNGLILAKPILDLITKAEE